ncbi:putative membrane protein YeiB [Tamaricihabitans halophyticus]|uniref:Putative membrane protein YeiB n=1 Tax=Tamaricihabitans halophyticus TaxID=1262583 RepID=A0A4R2R5V6_9PSEU|nr:DUF418 domain-containing protein [Tamaricihabitans halophyticus]TCP57404.1 putative membrane protein YeiB [Tamaricihabitans halophyticus]
MSEPTPLSTAARPANRIIALDALRGFALCGIIFINIPQTMDMLAVAANAPDGLRLFVSGRFYPIFCLLFGIGFGIFLASAMRRTANPRALLVRRLLMLTALGGLHHLLQPGEVLLWYGLTGLLVLLPFSYATGKVNALVGCVCTVAGLATGLGLALLPGIFLVGFALAQLGVPGWLVAARRALLIGLFGSAGVAALAYLAVTAGMFTGMLDRAAGLLFSLAMAMGYVAAFLLLLRLPLVGDVLGKLLAPLGRLALTNYLTATLLFVPLGHALGLVGSARWGTAALLATGILLVQLVWSHAWLRGFGYGPVEWAWRCVTYWRLLPIRPASDKPLAQAPHVRAERS